MFCGGEEWVMGSCEYHYFKQAEAVGVEVTGKAVTFLHWLRKTPAATTIRVPYIMYVLLASINSSQFKLFGLELE